MTKHDTFETANSISFNLLLSSIPHTIYISKPLAILRISE